MLSEEFEVHQQSGPIFAGHRKCRNSLRELDLQDFESGPDREWILIDQFQQQVPKALFVHA
jgi:hypothetical protein